MTNDQAFELIGRMTVELDDSRREITRLTKLVAQLEEKQKTKTKKEKP